MTPKEKSPPQQLESPPDIVSQKRKLTDKEMKAAFAILSERVVPLSDEQRKTANKAIARMITQELPELMKRLRFEDIGEFSEQRPDIQDLIADLARAEGMGALAGRHSKAIFRLAEETAFADSLLLLMESKALAGPDGEELRLAAKAALESRPEILRDIRAGKKKAAGALVGEIKAKTGADPKEIQEALAKEIESLEGQSQASA